MDYPTASGRWGEPSPWKSRAQWVVFLLLLAVLAGSLIPRPGLEFSWVMAAASALLWGHRMFLEAKLQHARRAVVSHGITVREDGVTIEAGEKWVSPWQGFQGVASVTSAPRGVRRWVLRFEQGYSPDITVSVGAESLPNLADVGKALYSRTDNLGWIAGHRGGAYDELARILQSAIAAVLSGTVAANLLFGPELQFPALPGAISATFIQIWVRSGKL